MSQSLRTRLMIGTAMATTIVLIIAAVSLYLLVRATLIQQVDQGLLAQAHAIIGMTEFKAGRISIEVDQGELPEFAQQAQRPWIFELLDDQGRVIGKSASLGEFGEMRHEWGSDPIVPVQMFGALPDGRDGRMLWLRFSPRNEDSQDAKTVVPGAVVGVGRDTEDLTSALTKLGWLLALVWAAATVVLIAVTNGIIRGAVRPVKQLSTQIEQIGTANLSERLQSDSVPSELSPIITRLNDLLGRLQHAFEQEKSFTADAAHELRTPLAGL